MATRKPAKPAKKTPARSPKTPTARTTPAKNKAKNKTKKKKQSALDALRPSLLALADARRSDIPVDRLVGEGNALVKLLDRHESALRKVGVDKKLLGSLNARVQALAEAQAELTVVRTRRRAKPEVKLEAGAVELRADLIAEGRYALRADDEAARVLDAIQEGEGLDDLVQDMSALATFVTKHRAAYEAIGVNAAKRVERAKALAAGLGSMVAERRTSDSDEEAALDLRDRAVTYLNLAMKEIRAAGAFAFRKDPEVLVRFRSAYLTAVRKRRAPGEAAETPAEPAPAPG